MTTIDCRDRPAEVIAYIEQLEAELEQYRGVAMTMGAEQALADYKRLEQALERIATMNNLYTTTGNIAREALGGGDDEHYFDARIETCNKCSI